MALQLPAWETDPDTNRCECCSRPMRSAHDFGTNKDGSVSQEYCDCCLADGNWLKPEVTMQELVDRCVDIWENNNIAIAEDARPDFNKLFPTLKRWQK